MVNKSNKNKTFNTKSNCNYYLPQKLLQLNQSYKNSYFIHKTSFVIFRLGWVKIKKKSY